MLQVVKAIIQGRAHGDKTEVDLIFANVTPQDILLKEDLDTLAKEDPGFRVHYVLDQPPEGWTGGVGYVTSDMITVRLATSAPQCIRPTNTHLAMATEARGRRQDSSLRPPSHGQRH
ncbi:hypothetical protein IMZ48_33295 [Candidatus Bathyarchaeota archaeon]|nr:hypothetical protein [Candidatus Bathyarchaeota archaeon]